MSQLFSDEKHLFRKQFSDDVEMQTWEAKEMNLKAHVVCGPCNNGWMSEFENNRAKPAMRDLIISDNPVQLTFERIAAIVAFGYKTAVVCHAMQRHESPYFPKDVFSPNRLLRFRKSLTVPLGIQVWLACISATDVRNGVVRLRYAKSPVGAPNPFKLYVCTFGAGRFLMQVVATEWTKSYARRRSVPALAADPRLNEIAVPVWPNGGQSVIWPPRKHLRGDAVNQFSDRWQRFTVPTFSIV